MRRLIALLLLLPTAAYATFPSVRSASTYFDDAESDATFSDVTLPATIEANDTLLVFCVSDSLETTTTFTFPAGWTKLGEVENTNVAGVVAIKDSVAGTEDGTDIEISLPGDESLACRLYAIQGASTSIDPEATLSLSWSSTPNPGSLAPSGGSAEYLWFAFAGIDQNFPPSAFPSGYADTTSSPDYQATGSNGWSVVAAWGYLESEAASEDPGPFTISSARNHVVATVAVYPSSPAASGNLLCDDVADVSVGAGTSERIGEIPCVKNDPPDQSFEVGVAIDPINPGYYINCAEDFDYVMPDGITYGPNAYNVNVFTGTPTTAGSFAASWTCDTLTENFTIAIAGVTLPDDFTGMGYFIAGSGSGCSDSNDGLTAVYTSGVNGPFCTAPMLETLTASGTNVYLQMGTFTVTDDLDVNFTGTSGDHGVISCYKLSGGTPISCDSDEHAYIYTNNGRIAALSINSKTYIDLVNVQVGINYAALTASSAEFFLIDINNSDFVTLRNVKCHPYPDQATAKAQGGWNERISCLRALGSDDGLIVNPDMMNVGMFVTYFGNESKRWTFRREAGQTGRLLNGWKDSIRVSHWQDSDHFDLDFLVEGANGEYMFELGGSYTEDAMQITTDSDLANPVIHGLHWKYVNCYGDTSEQCLDPKGTDNILIERSIIANTIGNNGGPSAVDGVDELYSCGALAYGTGTVTAFLTIRDSIVYDNCNGMWGPQNWSAYNVTFNGNNRDYTGSNSTYNSAPAHMAITTSSTSNGGTFVNNIVANHNLAQLSLSSGWQGNIDYNLYYDNSGSAEMRWSGTSGSPWYNVLHDLTEWQTLLAGTASTTPSGKDANSLEGDPLFVSFSNDPSGEYHAQSYDANIGALSPAVGAAGAITWADGAGGTGTTIPIKHCVFWPGDIITIGTDEVQVVSKTCNTTTKEIVVTPSITWADDDPILRPDYVDIGGCQRSGDGVWCP